jgi:hypothetical protein
MKNWILLHHVTYIIAQNTKKGLKGKHKSDFIKGELILRPSVVFYNIVRV